MLLLILGIILFFSLVVVHEYGHFLAARRNGVEVEEFAIGFPPRLWSKKMPSGFRLSFNLLPLGGYVRLKGEHDSSKLPGSFGRASLLAKIKIMLAGVAMNLVVAFALFTVLALTGLPKLIDNQYTVASDTKVVKQEVLIGYVEPGSPADQAGIKPGDKLLGLGSPPCASEPTNICEQIHSPEQLSQYTHAYENLEVNIQYQHEGTVVYKSVKLRSAEEVEASKSSGNAKGYLGVAPTQYETRRSTWSAPIVAAGLIKQFTVLTYQGLYTVISSLFHGNTSAASQQVAGPVGIFVILKDSTSLGIGFVLMLIAVISLTLALMNVLPIPALDGGRLFVTLLFRATRQKLTQKREEIIHGTGFVLLMLLFILITVVDVKRVL